jgi:hypothetical protein
MLMGKSVLYRAQNNPLTRFTVKTVILSRKLKSSFLARNLFQEPESGIEYPSYIGWRAGMARQPYAYTVLGS